MCHKLDARFFDELNQMNPADVCRRSLAEYDPVRKVYRIQALNELYEVDSKKREICSVNTETGAPVSIDLGLTIIFYLMQSVDLPITAQWISEKELRGGVTFFRGPHAFPTPEIARHCGKDEEALHVAAQRMGGEKIDMGDIGYKIRALPRVPIAVVFWKGDDEFPPECKLLMDSTIEKHLPLDVIFGLSIEIARNLTGLHLQH